MIQMFHVTKRYTPSDAPALVDVNLHVKRGEFVFVTGPSGAGKTTLLRLLFCEEQPTEGQILVDNINLSRIRPSAIPYFRRNIGVIFQDFRLLSRRTLAENVGLPLEVAGLPRSVVRKRTMMALKEVGLAHKLGAYPPTLSGGEQQRAAIARAIIADPKIILADEPTGNLDPLLTREIVKLLMDINLKGTTVVVATHDESVLSFAKKRVIRLERGRVEEDGGDGPDSILS